jgi:hypothetical protein
MLGGGVEGRLLQSISKLQNLWMPMPSFKFKPTSSLV